MRSGPLLALASAAVLFGACSTKPTGRDAGPEGAAPVSTLIPDAAPLNASTIPLANVLQIVNPEHLPAYAGPTGSVEGTVTMHGPPPPSLGLSSATFVGCPGAEKLYGTSFRAGPPSGPEDKRALADAIVVVTGYSGFYVPEKKEAAEVSIEGCGYSKRTVTMTFGQRLEVKNLTSEFWAPELDPKLPGALMMATPHGDAVKLYPKQAGRYHLVDHDRRYVIDDLMVFRHPLHGVTDVAGHYRVDGIPVGKMRVTVSHPQIPSAASTTDVDIQAGVVANVDLTLNYNPPSPPDAGAADAAAPYPGLH